MVHESWIHEPQLNGYVYQRSGLAEETAGDHAPVTSWIYWFHDSWDLTSRCFHPSCGIPKTPVAAGAGIGIGSHVLSSSQRLQTHDCLCSPHTRATNILSFTPNSVTTCMRTDSQFSWVDDNFPNNLWQRTLVTISFFYGSPDRAGPGGGSTFRIRSIGSFILFTPAYHRWSRIYVYEKWSCNWVDLYVLHIYMTYIWHICTVFSIFAWTIGQVVVYVGCLLL